MRDSLVDGTCNRQATSDDEKRTTEERVLYSSFFSIFLKYILVVYLYVINIYIYCIILYNTLHTEIRIILLFYYFFEKR